MKGFVLVAPAARREGLVGIAPLTWVKVVLLRLTAHESVTVLSRYSIRGVGPSLSTDVPLRVAPVEGYGADVAERYSWESLP